MVLAVFFSVFWQKLFPSMAQPIITTRRIYIVLAPWILIPGATYWPFHERAKVIGLVQRYRPGSKTRRNNVWIPGFDRRGPIQRNSPHLVLGVFP
jgi:hypothetical protein